MTPERRASQEAAAVVYGNDDDGATSRNKYVTFEQEAQNKKKNALGKSKTDASVLNIYRFMCPMPTISNMSEKS